MKRIRLIALFLVFALVIQFTPCQPGWFAVAAEGLPALKVTWQDTVRPDKAWTLTFNSPVNVLTVNSAHIKVFSTAGQEVPVLLRTALDGMSVSVRPQGEYEPGDYILKTLDGIKDIQGREQPQDVEIRFTVDGEPEPDAIEIAPMQVSLQPGQQEKFSASLAGGTSSQPFGWRIVGGGISGEFSGSVSADGLYQAPVRPGQYVVEVSSIEFPGLTSRAVVTVSEPPSAAIDLALEDGSLDIPANAMPGNLITLRAHVINRSAAGQCPGGTIVRFTINGRTIDEVPIYIDAGQTDAEARIWYYLPEGEYAAMTQGDVIPANVSAEIDPYGQLTETNEANNSAAGVISVRYAYDTPIQDTDPDMSIDATGLSVWSVKDDGPGDRVSAAQPGQKLRLMARINDLSQDSSEDVNIRFIVDGVVVMNDNRRVGMQADGVFESECNYQVPFNQSGPINFRVLLSNGSTAGIRIPVLQYDVGIRPGDLYWAGDTVAEPGQNLYLHALLKNFSSIQFPHEDARVSWRALIDGRPFAEGDYRLYENELNVSLPVFEVPEDQTEPILLTIITDAYDQLTESDERNNIASIIIPLVNNGLLTPNFYIQASDLAYSAAPIVPGSQVTLYANVHSQGAAFPNQPLEVLFKVNGQPIVTRQVDRNRLNPLQAEEVTTVWTAPSDLAGTPVFEVVLDPLNKIAEDSESDNSASLQLNVAKPDLDVTDNSITWDPEQPVTGSVAVLTAIVRNNGMAAASNVPVRFFADGQQIGETTIAQVPASSAAAAVFTWNIPEAPAADLPYNTVAGQSGKLPLPGTVTRSQQLTVQADPGNLIAETNEANNTSAGKTITVAIPIQRKFVYIDTRDSVSEVPAATVTLTAANGESATADTADDGWCTFTGVPAGSYTIQVSKEYYYPATAAFQTLDNVPAQYQDITLIRTKDFIGMSGADTDSDLLSDADEAFYGTNPNDPDSDDDGVIDGRDIAPLANPSDPVAENLQKPGMIRFDQTIGLHGVDGYVDVYDMEWNFSTLSDELKYSYRAESDCTRCSNMDMANIFKAINKAYAPTHFAAYYVSDLTAEQVSPGVAEDYPEKYADHVPEEKWIAEAGHILRTEYRFYYDFIVDYKKVGMMNNADILYPNEDSFFSYLLLPVKVRTGQKHEFSFQFTQSGLSGMTYYNSDDSYRALGIQYAFYKSDNFLDENRTDMSSVLLADNDGSDIFQFSITIPADKAALSRYFLKITPVWVLKENGTTTVSPASLNWNLSGLTREVTYSSGTDGSSKSVRESLTSIAGFDTEATSYATAVGLAAGKTPRTEAAGTLTYDPQAEINNRFQCREMQVTVSAYAGSGIGYLRNAVSATEISNIIYYKGKTMDDFPQNSMFRSPIYKNVTAGLELAGGLVSIYVNGKQAWKAIQSGDAVVVFYYAFKTLAGGATTGNALIKIGANIAATAGKTNMFTKFPTKEVGIGISIAIGVIEISYNVYRYNTTIDPIQKNGYLEGIVSSEFNLLIVIVTAMYPPLLAFSIAYIAVHEIYGFIWGRDKLAYILTSSPGSSFTFLVSVIITEDIPSVYGNHAYDLVTSNLSERFRVMNLNEVPVVPIYVDPMQ